MPSSQSPPLSSSPLLLLKQRPKALALLDLTSPRERATHDLLRRFCTGRWPLWKLLGLKRKARMLYAVVEWVRCLHDRFSVVELSLDEPALHWQYFASASAARAGLKKIAAEPVADKPASRSPSDIPNALR